ncbi:MAG: hypothetical protein M3Z11_09090 [Candidatus Dormibacteraeota bacterium]|nr:hypothetical protein [Candidatus Dormibacteraeota bacterium]
MRALRTRAFVRPAVLVSLMTGLVAGGIPLGASAGAAPVSNYKKVEVGMASAGARLTTSGSTVRQDLKGARQPQKPTRAAAIRAAGKTPSAADSSTRHSTGPLLRAFNGVSSRDSEVTNFGAKFEPPDQGLCAGNGFVLEPVNSAYTIYHQDGRPIAGPFNVNDLFGRGGLKFTSDPRCYYDKTTKTWFAVILFIGDNSDNSALDIAVNPSGDPTNASWKLYHIDTTNAGGPGCPCFGDQPRLGIDRFNLYVTTDEFSINGPEFNGTQLYAFAKRDLVRGSDAVHFVHFQGITSDGSLVTAPQPAITTGRADAEYLLGQMDPDNTGDNRLVVWALTNQAAVQSGGTPTLSSLIIQSEAYAIPPHAIQPNGVLPLDSGDDRMQQTQFIGNSLWGELTTAVTLPSDPAPRAGAAWFKVRPQVAHGVLTAATMVQQGYVTRAHRDIIYPALQANASGSAAMVFTMTGADLYPSASYATLDPGEVAFGRPQVGLAGTGNYFRRPTGFQSNRWGDYSWAQLDPDGRSVWMATEYIPPRGSQTTTGFRNWGTAVLQVRLSGDNQGGDQGGGQG